VCLCVFLCFSQVCGTGTQFTVPGASFDITGLLRSNDQPDYSVEDVDLPCETIANQKNCESSWLCQPCGFWVAGAVLVLECWTCVPVSQIRGREMTVPSEACRYLRVQRLWRRAAEACLLRWNRPSVPVRSTCYPSQGTCIVLRIWQMKSVVGRFVVLFCFVLFCFVLFWDGKSIATALDAILFWWLCRCGCCGVLRQCYVAGQHATYSLIDSTDPSKGIELMYTGGAQCNSAPNGGAPPARSLTIRIGCANIQNPVPTTANEVSHCAYLVEMDSFYGCPLECPVGGEARGVCSDHGVCAWDQSNARAHCFCDEGYTGADCSSVDKGTKSSGTSGAVIGLLVTVLLVAVVLGVVLFFVIRMLRAYRQDAHNYMAMHNQDLGTQDI